MKQTNNANIFFTIVHNPPLLFNLFGVIENKTEKPPKGKVIPLKASYRHFPATLSHTIFQRRSGYVKSVVLY
jgi:hypothetical protein